MVMENGQFPSMGGGGGSFCGASVGSNRVNRGGGVHGWIITYNRRICSGIDIRNSGLTV